MKKFKFLSVCFVVCALAAAFAIVPGAFAEDASADAPVAVTLNGALVEDLSFSKDEKVTLDAQTDLEGRIRWQYLADEAENLWVSVYGENSASFTLTYAKVFNMLNDENAAQIRCAVGEVFSDPVTVTLKEQSAPIAKAMSASPFALTRSAEEEGTGTDEGTTEGDVTVDTSEEPPYTFTIDYKDADHNWMDINGDGTADENDSYVSPAIDENMVVHLSVSSPYVEGMAPDVPVSDYVYQMIGNEPLEVIYRSGTPVAEGSSTDKYTYSVNFLKYGTNAPVAPSIPGELAVNTDFNTIITCPDVEGYLPYVQVDNYDYNAEGGKDLPGYPDGWIQTNTIQLIYFSNVSRSIDLNVYYMPAIVDYKVSYFCQNLNDDDYTLTKEVTLKGKTEDPVDADEINKVTYDGFTRLLYDDSVTIAADGSTEVEVYFDRNYYLMMFDLDGGYGVEPIYAPYQTPISITDPRKDGYAFDGWDNLGTPEIEHYQSAQISNTMPLDGATYKAQWVESDSYFTVAYWLEDPDVADKYNYWGSYKVNTVAAADGSTVAVKTGDTVDGADYQTIPDDVVEDYGIDSLDKRYSAYDNDATDHAVAVKGDGSSVVNVRYSRKEYTLKFYYAVTSETTNSSGTTTDGPYYYVIGGCAYYFGALATQNTDNEIKLLENYFTNSSLNEHIGKVDSIPDLNEEGKKRPYITGTDTSSVTSVSWWNQTTTTKYTYHYISFTAKYGADISELWPCNVFNSVTRTDKDNTNGWSGEEAYVSAWNGEHHVYYSQKHKSGDTDIERNQTIKGNYCKLDYQLLWDYTQYENDPDDKTVSYVCFWENGANIGWSVPERYLYHIYVPLLKGQSTEGLTTKDVDGNDVDDTTSGEPYYYLRYTYDTCDNSTYQEQTPPGIIGFTHIPVSGNEFDKYKWTPEEIEAANLNGLYSEVWDVNFYYARDEYKLTFNNKGNVIGDKTKDVPYETSFDEFYFEPDYPTGIEENAYDFEGWYTSETFEPSTKVDFNTMTMPAHSVVLYANWVSKQHTVEFYLDEEALNNEEKLTGYPDVTVTHGSKASGIADPTNGGYNFVAWFYKDENGVEKAFDFDMMPVTQDMQVYGKWKANAIRKYWVYYQVNGKDIADPEFYVADLTTGSGVVNDTKTFEAKGAEELYPQYQSHYFPTEKSHSFVLSLEEKENTYIFQYVKAGPVPYTVKYLKAGTNEVLHEQKVVEQNYNAVVTETFVPIANHIPDAYQKRLILTVDENGQPTGEENEIIFYYTEDTTHAYYKVGHYTENLDGTTWDEYASSEALGDIGKTYPTDNVTDGSSLKQNIPGFTFDPSVEGSVLSGELTSAGLELKLYYTRNEYPYEIRYINQKTTAKMADPDTGKGKYQAAYTGNAKSFFGYTCVSGPSQTKIIQIENGETAAKNIITFYYVENQTTYHYTVVGPAGCGSVSNNSETVNVITGDAVGSTATANEGYRFVGWYSDSACTDLVSTDASYIPQKTIDSNGSYYTGGQYYAKFIYDTADLKITKSGVDETLDPNTEFLFRVQGDPTDAHTRDIDITVTVTGNGLVVVNDLPVGKYTVTEITDWSWRYTPAEKVKNVTVVSEASIIANIVTFANSRKDDNKWLDYNVSADNLFKPNSTPEIGNE